MVTVPGKCFSSASRSCARQAVHGHVLARRAVGADAQDADGGERRARRRCRPRPPGRGRRAPRAAATRGCAPSSRRPWRSRLGRGQQGAQRRDEGHLQQRPRCRCRTRTTRPRLAIGAHAEERERREAERRGAGRRRSSPGPSSRWTRSRPRGCRRCAPPPRRSASASAPSGRPRWRSAGSAPRRSRRRSRCPVWPMSPSPHTVLSTAVSIGMIMPWRLRNDSQQHERRSPGRRAGCAAPSTRDCAEVGERDHRLAGEVEVDAAGRATRRDQVEHAAARSRAPAGPPRSRARRAPRRWSGVTSMPRSCGSLSTWRAARRSPRASAARRASGSRLRSRRRRSSTWRTLGAARLTTFCAMTSGRRSAARVTSRTMLQHLGLPHVAARSARCASDHGAPAAELLADRLVDADERDGSPAGSPRR